MSESGTPQGPSAPSVHNQIDVDRQAVAGSASGTRDDIVQLFAQVDPEAISQACVTWNRAASILGYAAQDVMDLAAQLEMAWSAGSSVFAQEQLRAAHATLAALGDDCIYMTHTTNQAAQYAEWYKQAVPEPGLLSGLSDKVKSGADTLTQIIDDSGAQSTSTGVIGKGGAAIGSWVADHAPWSDSKEDEAAREHADAFLSRYNETLDILPPTVQLEIVEVHDDPDPGVYRTESGGGTDAGGKVGRVGTPEVTSWSGGESTTGGGVSAGGLEALSDPYARSSDASLAGGGGLSGLGGSGVAGPGSGLGTGGLGPGAGTGYSGSGLGTGSGIGAGGVIGGGGRAGAAGGAGARGYGAGTGVGTGRGAGAAGGAGVSGRSGMLGGMPMGAGGRGKDDEEERERYSWLMEDEDVWGANTDAHPPIISE